MTRCAAGFERALERLFESLGEVGPRRACVVAKHGMAVVKRRAELRRYLPNRIVGQYLKGKYRTEDTNASVDYLVRVSRK